MQRLATSSRLDSHDDSVFRQAQAPLQEITSEIRELRGRRWLSPFLEVQIGWRGLGFDLAKTPG